MTSSPSVSSAKAAPSSRVQPSKPLSTRDHAEALAKRFIIIDGHIDVPYRLRESRDKSGKLTENIAERTQGGDFDHPRALEGGLDAPFMSIYIPARYQKRKKGQARQLADELIDMVEQIAKRHPRHFSMARSVKDIRQNHEAGRVSFLLGIENGAALEKEIANVAHFHQRGVRYITLTHSEDNLIGDSSYASAGTWKGLSPFGKRVIQEMNRVGILVDVSHVSDRTFDAVMDIAQVPAIASHSACRHFTPGFERNMSDVMIRRLAKNRGVLMINFGSSFVSQASRKYFDGLWQAKGRFRRENGLAKQHPRVKAFEELYRKEKPAVYATVKSVADHIDHVVKLVGIDHVGFGSDFDGVGDSLPRGLKDVSHYPNLIEDLLRRGYSEEDIEKICSGNVLRVLSEAERFAARGDGS